LLLLTWCCLALVAGPGSTARLMAQDASGAGDSATSTPPKTTEKNSAAAPGQASSCDAQSGSPFAPESIAGTWLDADSRAPFVISQPDPKSATTLEAKGSHDWDGGYQNGKLTFTRKPRADEMSDAAPLWARELMEGEIQWTLELDPQIKCGTPTLKGKWYPGAIKFTEEYDEQGNLTRKEATSDGKGKPIDVEFRRQIIARTFLYVKGVFHTFLVDTLWQDVPLFVGVAFIEPNPAAEYPVSIKIGDQKIDLVAKPVDDKHKYFETGTFAVLPP
jgi:hypothetical protein